MKLENERDTEHLHEAVFPSQMKSIPWTIPMKVFMCAVNQMKG